eukprot:CAMPEP_0178381220 /NCGR_PEP_ID=MMETSP0689_2-20121128/5868_1 /TAXON_ID=160604 /ORGANISM="Amphidinium massartii, Strain CS-259" /LENGTH=364 /DNA_ID=CAMNT_0020001391 /DNA_START=225 /DNA_END=1319 /DNA_ORIENTATION=+
MRAVAQHHGRDLRLRNTDDLDALRDKLTAEWKREVLLQIAAENHCHVPQGCNRTHIINHIMREMRQRRSTTTKTLQELNRDRNNKEAFHMQRTLQQQDVMDADLFASQSLCHSRLKIGDGVRARVKKIVDYGVFVDILEPARGVGFVHVREIDDRFTEKIEEKVDLNAWIRAIVIEEPEQSNKAARRNYYSLSIREAKAEQRRLGESRRKAVAWGHDFEPHMASTGAIGSEKSLEKHIEVDLVLLEDKEALDARVAAVELSLEKLGFGPLLTHFQEEAMTSGVLSSIPPMEKIYERLHKVLNPDEVPKPLEAKNGEEDAAPPEEELATEQAARSEGEGVDQDSQEGLLQWLLDDILETGVEIEK